MDGWIAYIYKDIGRPNILLSGYIRKERFCSGTSTGYGLGLGLGLVRYLYVSGCSSVTDRLCMAISLCFNAWGAYLKYIIIIFPIIYCASKYSCVV